MVVIEVSGVGVILAVAVGTDIDTCAGIRIKFEIETIIIEKGISI